MEQYTAAVMVLLAIALGFPGRMANRAKFLVRWFVISMAVGAVMLIVAVGLGEVTPGSAAIAGLTGMVVRGGILFLQKFRKRAPLVVTDVKVVDVDGRHEVRIYFGEDKYVWITEGELAVVGLVQPKHQIVVRTTKGGRITYLDDVSARMASKDRQAP